MAEEQAPRRRRRLRPARPLYGYRDIGAPAGARHTRQAVVRAIYFAEPGLR
jgi:hypothetical protein